MRIAATCRLSACGRRPERATGANDTAVAAAVADGLSGHTDAAQRKVAHPRRHAAAAACGDAWPVRVRPRRHRTLSCCLAVVLISAAGR